MGPRLLGVAFMLAFLAAAPAAQATVRSITPAGPSLLSAYAASADGDVIELAGGVYPRQTLPEGTKAITVRPAAGQVPDLVELTSAVSNATVQGLKMRRLHITGGTRTVYESLDIDGRFAQQLTLEHGGGSDLVLRNSRVGNVTDEKGAIIGETRFTIDNVVFHDVHATRSEVHNECIYATGSEGFTLRNSRFYNCAAMDVLFTNYVGGPDYGNVTLENNVFEHSVMEDQRSWHYYSLYVGNTGPTGGDLRNWVVRNNTFEIDARVSAERAVGSRWVGNLGGWDCVPGLVYSHNVGGRCGPTDKAVSPDSSTAALPAPFRWVAPASHDFRIAAGSPAIDAGDPADFPLTDRDGLLRAGPPDAGAHEFGGREPAGGAPPVGPPVGSPANAPRLVSASLRPRTICAHRRRGCAAVSRLRLALSTAARVSVRVERVRSGRAPKRARSIGANARTRRTVTIRARGLSAGRYRVHVQATDATGLKSRARSFALRVR